MLPFPLVFPLSTGDIRRNGFNIMLPLMTLIFILLNILLYVLILVILTRSFSIY